MTFLALGNGAPDIFSAMAAISRPHTAGLAMGALFGECSNWKANTFKSYFHICLLFLILCVQELAFLSPQLLLAAWHLWNLLLWLHVHFFAIWSFTWPQCFGHLLFYTEGLFHLERRWVCSAFVIGLHWILHDLILIDFVHPGAGYLSLYIVYVLTVIISAVIYNRQKRSLNSTVQTAPQFPGFTPITPSWFKNVVY